MLHVERPDVAFGRKPFRKFPPTPRRQAGGLAERPGLQERPFGGWSREAELHFVLLQAV